MGKHRKLPSKEQLDRENTVFKLRAAGMNWTMIGEQVGYADHTGAIAAYRRAMQRYQEPARDEARTAEIDRIDRLQMAAWQKAMKGDLDAIRTVLKCIDARCRIMGIYEAVKIDQTITLWEGGDTIDKAIKELTELLSANDNNSQGAITMGEDTSSSEPTTTD